MQRSKDISEVRYQIAYAMLRGGKNYHGQVKIQFTLNKGADLDSVFVDYRGEKVLRLSVNGSQVTEGSPFRDHRIYFPSTLLQEGANEVEIRFVSKYVRDCQGIHYFVDKDDNEEYIYSQYEAADAHKAFPCFDQPDLKAPYTLLVLVPQGWLALSTS
jgi:aminopeptidase N